MNVLKILENPAFSFQYNGNPFDTVQCKVSKENTLGGDGKVNEYRITYLLPDGLEIIQSLKEYPEFDACEWVLQLWNHSSERSGLISDLNDCDINLEFAYDAMPKQGYLVPDSVTRIHRLLGSNFSPIDFSLKEHSIIPGQKRKYATWGGLSSSWGPISQQTGEPQIIYSPDGEEIHNSAPFFDLNHGEHGVICAIGWTGQWNASFTRNEKGIQVQTGIEDLCFRLLPGEKIRTSSILLMEYRNGQNNGHNSFRRLVKEHFSLIGKPGREQNGPLSTLNWGSVPSQQMLERIDTLAKNEMGFEYFWIDAAWYGNCTCKDEYDRDWDNSSESSGLLSDLNDCDFEFEFKYDETPLPGRLVPESMTKIHNLLGSNCARQDFSLKNQVLYPTQTIKYAPWNGRSSGWGPIGIKNVEAPVTYSPENEPIFSSAPFFDLNQEEHGVICAVGWTGQWNASFTRTEKGIRVKTGIEALSFRLLPGEKIRTSSIVLMEYCNGQDNGHNRFRRLVKENFSLIGKPGREQQGPLSIMNWGAIPTQQMLERIEKVAKNDLGFEYFWIDAAWYGECTSADEHEKDWFKQTGNWTVNGINHPDQLMDVAKAVKDNGMKFLLWFEPERVYYTTPTAQKHPEWFFKLPEGYDKSEFWLMNLGNPEALKETIDMISYYIENLGLDCYRQDLCAEDPLSYWRLNDEPERKGINEIKHIMGLYKFWDTLLSRFPHLLIDNCASGGRRIDIEMVRRSMALWRSDYQCIVDYEPEYSQNHNSGISWWLPYSGISPGGNSGLGDMYRFRSSYSASLCESFWVFAYWDIEDKEVEWVKKANEEYKRARPYFSCDYYPLLAPVSDNSNWCAWQYDRPEQSDGIVLAFRRPDSPFETSSFALSHVKSGMMYRFEDADTGEITEISSDTLLKNGLTINLPEKRSSKLLYGKRGF